MPRTPRLLLALVAGTALASAQSPTFDLARVMYPVTAPAVNLGSMAGVLDVNGDGIPDVATQKRTGTYYQSAAFDTLVNQGDGTLVPGPYSFVFTLGCCGVNAGELPRMATGRLGQDDGRDDLVGAYGATIQGMMSAASTPLTVGPVVLTERIRGVTIRDFDLDGSGDIGVVTTNTLFVFRSTGASTFSPTSVALPTGETAVALLVCEATGDNYPDLVVHTLASILIYPYTASGIAPSPVTLPLTAPADSVIAGDVDGDGDEDLTAFSMAGNGGVFGGVVGAYVVHRRTGPGVFSPEPQVLGGPASHLFDVDGDGDLDGVCCGGGGATQDPIPGLPSFFRVSLNDGSGTFAPCFEIPGYGAFHLAGVADMDGNGTQDLVGGRAVYFTETPLSAPPHPVAPAGTGAVNPVDVEGDGDPDFSLGSSTTWWNQGNGVGALGAPLVVGGYPAGHSPGIGYPGDWDGDGDPDLVVEVWSGGAPVALHFVENRGGAFFDRGRAFPLGVTATPYIGNGSERVLARDIDGDGDLDLLARTPVATGGFTHIWLNDGTGNFPSAIDLQSTTVVEVADFTNDGIPDILVSGGDLRVRRGLGGGAFGPGELLDPQAATTPFYYWYTFDAARDRLAIADFDEDGDLDIVALERTSSQNGGSVVYLKNRTDSGNQAGLFTSFLNPAVAVVSTGTTPAMVFAADVDQDGHVDAVYNNPRVAPDGGIGVIFGDPSLFVPFDSARTLYLAGNGLRGVADVDGDGDPDLIGQDFIAKGTHYHGPSAGSIVQYATGDAGTDGIIPSIGSARPVRVGETSTVRIAGGLGGALGVLGVGLAPAQTPFLGGTEYIAPLFFVPADLSGPAGVSGVGSKTVTLGTIEPYLAGVSVYLQGGFLDPMGPGGISRTYPIEVRIGW